MKLGFALPHIGPIATRDNIREAAQEAEALGYHSLWTNERVLVPLDAKTPYPGAPDRRRSERRGARTDRGQEWQRAQPDRAARC